MITSTQGFVPQSDKYSRFMAGDSLQNYVELRRGEFAYNRGNSKTYPLGCIFRLNEWDEAAVPNVYISFALDESQVDAGFASQFFAAGGLNDQLKRVITSGARSNGLLNISVDDFFACRMPVPPLLEQRRIADVLGSLDEAILSTQAVVEQARRVKDGLLQDLLTKGVGDNRLIQANRGQLPDGWQMMGLFDIADFQNGKAFPSDTYCSEGVRLVRPGNLHVDNVVLWDEEHTTCVPERYWDESPEHQVGPGEVLMNLTAQSLADNFLGRVCMTPAENRCLLNQRIGRLTPKDAVSRDYLFWVLQGPQFRAHMVVRGQGSKVQHLYNRDLESARLPVPPAIDQGAIARSMWDARDAVEAAAAAQKAMLQIKAGLRHELFTGRTRVSA